MIRIDSNTFCARALTVAQAHTATFFTTNQFFNWLHARAPAHWRPISGHAKKLLAGPSAQQRDQRDRCADYAKFLPGAQPLNHLRSSFDYYELLLFSNLLEQDSLVRLAKRIVVAAAATAAAKTTRAHEERV